PAGHPGALGVRRRGGGGRGRGRGGTVHASRLPAVESTATLPAGNCQQMDTEARRAGPATARAARDGGDGRHEHVEVPRRAWVGLWLGAAAALVVSLNVAGTNMAFPAIEEAFPETSRAVLSWTISGYNIGLAAFLLIGGRLAD